MLEKQAETNFSTDVGGFFVDPLEVKQLTEKAGFRCKLEIIAMPRQMIYLNNLAQGYGNCDDVGGIHGRLGSSGGLKEKVADALLSRIEVLEPIAEKVGELASSKVYINSHNKEVVKNFPQYERYVNRAKNSYLTIENGIMPGDIEETDNLIEKLGNKTRGMFDLVHAIVPLSEGNLDIQTVSKFWSGVLNKISDRFGGLHFPIGKNKNKKGDDSLPILEMLVERSMLKDLAAIQKEKGLSITIENQHNLLWGANRLEEVKRLREIREGMLECGFNV